MHPPYRWKALDHTSACHQNRQSRDLLSTSCCQELRLENLELMQAYGPAQTKVQNDEFETIKVGMTAQVRRPEPLLSKEPF